MACGANACGRSGKVQDFTPTQPGYQIDRISLEKKEDPIVALNNAIKYAKQTLEYVYAVFDVFETNDTYETQQKQESLRFLEVNLPELNNIIKRIRDNLLTQEEYSFVPEYTDKIDRSRRLLVPERDPKNALETIIIDAALPLLNSVQNIRGENKDKLRKLGELKEIFDFIMKEVIPRVKAHLQNGGRRRRKGTRKGKRRQRGGRGTRRRGRRGRRGTRGRKHK